MKRLITVGIIFVAVIVYAGMPKNEDILYNLLEINGYKPAQIDEIMSLDRFPTFDSIGTKLKRGDQLYVGDNYESVVILSINNANNSVMFNKSLEKRK